MGLKNKLEAIFVLSLEAEYLVFCVEQWNKINHFHGYWSFFFYSVLYHSQA